MTLRTFSFAALAIAATTVVAIAKPVVAVPDTLKIPVGAVGRVMASTPGWIISVEGGTCFRTATIGGDLVRVVVVAHVDSERGSKIALDLHGLKPGSCEFGIRSGSNVAKVQVHVVPS